MKSALFIFVVLCVYLLNEYRLIRKYSKAIEQADKN